MQRGKRRMRRGYPLMRLLIIAGIALLVASIMIQRILRPLHWRPYSRVSRIALQANSAVHVLLQ
jgi:hypothetical protein